MEIVSEMVTHGLKCPPVFLSCQVFLLVPWVEPNVAIGTPMELPTIDCVESDIIPTQATLIISWWKFCSNDAPGQILSQIGSPSPAQLGASLPLRLPECFPHL